jgi:hypothetical protein
MNFKYRILLCCSFCFITIMCNGQSTKTNENKIISFKEGPQEVSIDETNKKIVFSVPGFVDITKIKPTIKVSDGATLSPASDTEQDFSKPFTYTVKASDGKIVSYTVIVSKRESIDGMPPKSGKPLEVSMDTKKAQLPISLSFDLSKYEVQTQDFEGKAIKVRAFERIVYVSNPSDIDQQIINIYIPEEYFNGRTINGYTAKTAPIFFPNKVGGYMPAQPAIFISTQNSGGRGGPQSNAVQMALSKGLIVASAGARGRTSPIGKAPAGIVDLKAAIRYMKFNDKTMPGDANMIISNGTSAGGAMSTLIGATGNHPDYELYLKAIGAADATDNIFAVSAYCPIINLENADMAYEWQLNKIHSFNFRGKSGNLEVADLKVSEELKNAFPAYFNSLNLINSNKKPLKLNANGEGNFKELVKSYLVASAQKAIDEGTDLSKHTFLKIKNNKVLSVDFYGYMVYLERMKTPPAFDALNNSSPENQLFGTATIDKRHFTSYALQKSTSEASALADIQQIKMMNPMKYIGNKAANTSKYWRVRHGAKDKDTGFAVPIILATALQNKGFNVDFALPWDKPHSGDYDLDDLFKWIDNICKK